MVKENEKPAALEQELEQVDEKRAIVFVNTKRQCDAVTRLLEDLGFRYVRGVGVLVVFDIVWCTHNAHISLDEVSHLIFIHIHISFTYPTPHPHPTTPPHTHCTPTGVQYCMVEKHKISVRLPLLVFVRTNTTCWWQRMWQGVVLMSLMLRWW